MFADDQKGELPEGKLFNCLHMDVFQMVLNVFICLFTKNYKGTVKQIHVRVCVFILLDLYIFVCIVCKFFATCVWLCVSAQPNSDRTFEWQIQSFAVDQMSSLRIKGVDDITVKLFW